MRVSKTHIDTNNTSQMIRYYVLPGNPLSCLN